MSQNSTKNAKKQESVIKIKTKINEMENKETTERFNKPKADLEEENKT